MPTRRKENDRVDPEETVLGGRYGEWIMVTSGTSLDIRRCSNCGFASDFPKDMNNCIWTKCPECGKTMRW